MKVCVIGLGYIGLPTALMLAANGSEVVGIDYNKELVKSLQEGKLTFDEKGLQELFDVANKNNITFVNNYIKNDFYIVAVPTPYNKSSKKIDPAYVIKAVEAVLEVCENNTTIVIESTVSPGTIDRFIRPIITKSEFASSKDIHVVHAPERIIPGNMIYELLNNSRTIGADSREVAENVKSVYASFCKSEIVVTDVRTAEMTKVVENTFRDINIAFVNELAKICRKDNMNVYEIIKIANMHPRVNILQPGPGVGGHCISVDPWFLVGDYPELSTLIRQARLINDAMPEFVLERIAAIMEENNITDIKRVGLYGLTYKEDVDDIRESPTLQLLECARKHLAPALKVYDPLIKSAMVTNQYNNFDKFLSEIDIVIIMVGHTHIKQNIAKLENKVVFDTRNICELPNAYKI